MPTAHVGLGTIVSALSILILVRYGPAVLVIIPRMPTVFRRGGLLGLGWGLLVAAFLAFILWLRHRSSCQQRDHELVQSLKRAEDQTVDRLLRELAPLLRNTEPHLSPQVAGQLFKLAELMMRARQGIDVQSSSLSATLTPKEGSAMPDVPPHTKGE
jgi:hypothetical protein